MMNKMQFPHKIYFDIFIKISKMNYLQDIQEGKLHMNNLKYFVDLEKNTRTKGIGDINEASLLNIKKHKLFVKIDGEKEREINIGPAPGIIYNQEALFYPVFCLMHKTIELVYDGEQNYIGKVNISKNDIDEFIHNDETGALVIISPNDFLMRVKERLSSDNVECMSGNVEYIDFRIPREKDQGILLRNVFTKSKEFENQCEYRIVLLTKSEKAIDLKIDPINDISFIVDLATLINGFTIKWGVEGI